MWIYIDLDGTILDVFERYSGIFNLYVNQFGRCISKAEYKRLRQAGFSEHDILEKKWDISVDREEHRRFKHQHLERREWLKKDTLIGNPEQIKKYDCNFAIITQRNNEKEAIYQMESLKLDSFFDEIIVLEPCLGKNSKLEYLRNRVSKEDCIIGDSPIELECARKLGMKGGFVKTGLFGVQEVQNEAIGSNYLKCLEMILGGK